MRQARRVFGFIAGFLFMAPLTGISGDEEIFERPRNGFGASLTFSTFDNDDHLRRAYHGHGALLDVYWEPMIETALDGDIGVRFGYAHVAYGARSEVLLEDIEAHALYTGFRWRENLGFMKDLGLKSAAWRRLGASWELDLGVSKLEDVQTTDPNTTTPDRERRNGGGRFYRGFGMYLDAALGRSESLTVFAGWHWRHFGELHGVNRYGIEDRELAVYGYVVGVQYRW